MSWHSASVVWGVGKHSHAKALAVERGGLRSVVWERGPQGLIQLCTLVLWDPLSCLGVET